MDDWLWGRIIFWTARVTQDAGADMGGLDIGNDVEVDFNESQVGESTLTCVCKIPMTIRCGE